MNGQGGSVQRRIYGDEHEMFRDTVRAFLAKEVVPEFGDWEARGAPPRDFYRRAGEVGLLGIQVPEEYGGGGATTFKFNAVLTEEAFRARVGLGSLRVHMDIVLPYILRFATENQRRRWLPGMASGELMTAIAMTEPGTGSDLAGISSHAVRDGEFWVLNGSKTFITGGSNADLVLVVARTAKPGTDRRSGLSILVVETDSPGFAVGKLIGKIGMHAQDTVELSFDDVRVRADNLLGEEGAGFSYLGQNLPQERLAIALGATAAATSAISATIDYVTQRQIFERTLSSFQNTKFVLAECATEVEAAQVLCDRALEEHEAGELSPVDAAKVKLFCTEVQGRVVDKCLQLHGGYGYTTEYPIARLYADARVTRIYGGTSEVLKTIVAKSLAI
jgi:alkylation response protein AidB-like acyl-CoA dehydrogenase